MEISPKSDWSAAKRILDNKVILIISHWVVKGIYKAIIVQLVEHQNLERYMFKAINVLKNILVWQLSIL